jgi:hypothetical protein
MKPKPVEATSAAQHSLYRSMLFSDSATMSLLQVIWMRSYGALPLDPQNSISHEIHPDTVRSLQDNR